MRKRAGISPLFVVAFDIQYIFFSLLTVVVMFAKLHYYVIAVELACFSRVFCVCNVSVWANGGVKVTSHIFCN